MGDPTSLSQALMNLCTNARDAMENVEGTLTVLLEPVAMGAEGGVTRLAGGLFGTDITFAIGKTASAPGQIPIGPLRQAMAVLYE